MSDIHRILVVDDDPSFNQVLCRALRRRELEVLGAEDTDAALALATEQPPSHAIVDLKLEGPSGLSLLAPLLAINPDMKILILTGYSSIATAVEAIKLGAVNYLCKPASTDEILQAFEGDSSAEELTAPEQPHSVERLQWEHIQRVLQDHDGNISATARALGMHRRTLQRKLNKRPVRLH